MTDPSSLWNQGGWKDVPTRNLDELEREPAAPLGSDQALVESALKRGNRNSRSPTSGNGLLGPSVPWDDRHLLVRSGNGFCLLPNQGADLCQPIVVPGVDNEFADLTRDASGRTWLSGRGLWFLDEHRRGVAVHPYLPFLRDTDVHSFAIVETRLILALGLRGLALLDLADLNALPPGVAPPAVPEWDRPRSHEPKATDGAVFVALVGSPAAPDTGYDYETAKGLKAIVEASDLTAYEIDLYAYRDGLRGMVICAFGTPDPDSLLRLVVRALAGSPIAPALRIFVRHGGAGAPLAEVPASP